MSGVVARFLRKLPGAGYRPTGLTRRAGAASKPLPGSRRDVRTGPGRGTPAARADRGGRPADPVGERRQLPRARRGRDPRPRDRGRAPPVAAARTRRAGEGQHRHRRTRLDRRLAGPRRRAARSATHRWYAGCASAGMVVLGKTNLSEWANIRDEHSTSGWSAHGGLTRNPYALNRTAWGSSSGQRCGGRGPAGAVRGRHRDQRLDHRAGRRVRAGRAEADGRAGADRGRRADLVEPGLPGPMALTVADTAALLDAMAGTSTADDLERSVRGRRIGVPRDLWGYSPAADAASERALVDVVADAGAVDRRRPRPAGAEGPRRRGRAHPDAGRAQGAPATYLATRDAAGEDPGGRDRLQPRGTPTRSCRGSARSSWRRRRRPRASRRAAYLEAVDACTAAGLAELDRTLGEHDLDALIAPAIGAGTADRPGERRPGRRRRCERLQRAGRGADPDGAGRARPRPAGRGLAVGCPRQRARPCSSSARRWSRAATRTTGPLPGADVPGMGVTLRRVRRGYE